VTAPFQCCYIAGTCWHPECGSYGEPQPHPTEEDYCAEGGHAYYGDEFDPATVPEEHRHEVGRCYCGKVRYPAGGPEENGRSGSDG
jgi:hypothetical protein